MILDAGRLVAWYPHFAKRHRRVNLCDSAAAHIACERAAMLASGAPRLEPAAIFFVFAETRRAFPFAWKLMAAYVAFLQAQSLGLALRAGHEELNQLCTEVLFRRAGWDEVRAWFDLRLRPIADPSTPGEAD